MLLFLGDAKVECDPSFYRTDEDYSHLVSSVHIEEPEGGQKIGYKIVLKKKIQAYMKVWLMSLKVTCPDCNPTFPQTGSSVGKWLDVSKMCVLLLSQIKNNPNQVYWLLEKVSRSHDN